jgi:ferrous iron transport protein A
LQENLVTEMAGRLGVQLHEIEMARALKKPGDITAYEALQRALAHWWNLSAANFSLLIAEARRAVTIVPDYGYAHGVLAYALALQFVWSDAKDAALKQEAFDHARHAIAIDPNDAMALTFAAGALALGEVRLSQARLGDRGIIGSVGAPADQGPGGLDADELERRLLELGFVEGATLEVIHEGALGGDPIAVRLDDMRVALRRRDARDIIIVLAPEPVA